MTVYTNSTSLNFLKEQFNELFEKPELDFSIKENQSENEFVRSFDDFVGDSSRSVLVTKALFFEVLRSVISANREFDYVHFLVRDNMGVLVTSLTISYRGSRTYSNPCGEVQCCYFTNSPLIGGVTIGEV